MAIGALILLLPALTAVAAEGSVFGGPTGGTDIRNAYLPAVPGFYGSLVGDYNYAGRIYGDDGQWERNTHVVVNAGVLAGGLSYVYPFKLFGGVMDSSVQQAYIYDKLRVGARDAYDCCAGDLYSELLGWSKYLGPMDGSARSSGGAGTLPVGLTVKLAYSMIFPTGEYSRNDLAPSGHNDFFFIPNAAATYLTRPNRIGDGIEFDGHIFVDLASRNRTTDYTSGPVLDFDFAVSDRIGRFQLGVAGFYAQQLLDDRVGGHLAPPNGKKYEVVEIGPVAAVDFPKSRASLKFKVASPLVVHNGFNTTRFIMIYSLKL